jgi:hypothetical protein
MLMDTQARAHKRGACLCSLSLSLSLCHSSGPYPLNISLHWRFKLTSLHAVILMLFSHIFQSTSSEIQQGQRYCCDECGKSFSQQFYLTAHQPIHNGDQSFCCDACDKSFDRKHELNTHERIYSGEWTLCCNVCNKSFSREHHLKTHQRIHSG